MRRHLLLTLALVLGSLTGAWASTVDFADPLPGGHEGPGTIYYKLNTETKEATVVAGTWQYTGQIFIPDEVEYLGEPYEVTKIAGYAFRNSYDLDLVDLGANLHTIESNAFYMCGTTERPVVINFDSDGLEVLQSNAINQVVLAPNRGDSIVFGKNVKQLGDASTTTTSNWYSWGTRLGVKYYGVEDGNSYFCVENGVLYDKDKTRLISYPRSNAATSFVIPSSVTTVCTYAFQNVQNVTKITGGENVVRIGSVISGSITSFPVGPAVSSMSSTAFMYCTNSFLPVVSEANTRFKLKGSPETGYALYDYKFTVKNDPNTYVALCRYFRTVNVTTFRVPADVTYIGDYAFYSHPYVKYVDFQDCTGLKSSKISGTAFHSTTYSVEMLNSESIFANIDGVLYTDDKKTMVIYGSNVTMPNYVMPAETKTIPVSAIKANEYVKTFAINSVCSSINTEYLDNMFALERYSVAAGNSTYYTDTCGVLYTKTTLLSYPRANTRSYYRVADGTTQINVRAFYRNRFLKVLDLGSDIKSVVNGNNNTLSSMTGLAAIKVSTMVPPTVTTSSFSNTQLTSGKIKLYVPLDEGAADIYANASVWNRFYIIRDTSRFESDIRDIDVDYVINHYQQNIDDDGYTKAETNKTKGKLLSTTAVAAKTTGDFAGFEPQPFNQITLNKSNMSVDIYYHRRPFSVTWMNGSTQIRTKIYRYGAPFLADKPADPTPVAGKHFIGWNTESDATVALTFNGSERVLSNITYYAIFADNASKKYHVEHYQQNVNGNGYTKIDTDEDSKPFGLQTTAVAKTYEGFTAQSFSQQTIAEDESTVVRINYDRNEYTVTWMNGSTVVLSGDYRYGSTLQVPANPSAVAGQHFVGWNTNQAAATGLPVTTQTVPLDGAIYYAIFATNGSKTYTVEHYQQNLDGQNYTRIDADTETGSGTQGLQTAAVAKNYPGFTVQPFSQETIAESGTVVKIYYNRNRYDVVWKKGTETLSTNANVMFGAAIQTPTDPAAVAGQHFVGWNTDSQATTKMNLEGATVPVDGITYYAIFATNATVHYTIKHYQEKLEGGYPTEPTDTDEGTGTIGLQTDARTKTYVGFTAQTFAQQTIAESGTEVIIEYKRNIHTLTWNANGGTISGGTSGSIKYGAPITEPSHTRTGFEFKGWGKAADAETGPVATTMPDSSLTYYAIWKVREFQAFFYLNNGTTETWVEPLIEFDTPIEEPGGRPQPDNYDGHHDFIGWSKTSNGDVITNGNFGKMTADGAVFYAIWKVHSNQLTWDANGGNALTGTYTSGTVDYGTTIKKPNTPTRTGYTFKGWSTTSVGTPTDVPETMPDEVLTYYAIWQINEHSLTWNTNGGGALTGDYTSGSVKYGVTISKPANPERYGYEFIGWGTAANATTTVTPATTMPDNDLTYYAVWNVHKHNLKWYPNGGSFTNSDPSGLLSYGDSIKMPLVNRTNWKMAGWATFAEATPNDVQTPAQTMPDSALTYYAIWILKTNYVTWKQNYYEDDDANFTATSVDVDSLIVAPANNPTRQHYQFIGWSATRDGDVITGGNFGIMDTNKKEFYARWELNKNMLTWNANGGEIANNGTSGMVEFNAPITPAIVSARTGYDFKGWGTSANATENDTIEITTMPDAATTYYAVWKPKTYQVEWKYNDGSNGTFETTEVVFDDTIVAPLSNPTRDYNKFAGWASTPEGEVITDFGTLASEGATFYAKWQLKKFTLAWDANGGVLSGDYTQGEVEYGTQIITPTVTLENYIHAGWGTTANPDSAVNITTMPDSSVTYVAIWTNDNIEWRKNYEPDGNYTATTVNLGEPILPPVDDPERSNYEFLGWSDATDGEVITDFGTMDSDHKIFYAIWQKNSHELAWNANGGLLSGDYTSGNVEVGTEIVRPVAERTGYTFNGWNTYAEAVDSISISTMPDNDVEYFAIWKVNNYNLAWRMNNATDSVFASATVNYNDTINAPSVNPEREGFTFQGWATTADGIAVDSFGLMPAADTSFYAVWKQIVVENKFALLWYKNDGTSSVFVTDSLAQGDSIAVPSVNPEREGFTFQGWAAAADGIAVDSFGLMPAADTAFYAVWTPVETVDDILTVQWKLNDGSADVFKTDTLFEGSTIMAPAEKPLRDGYTFLGWSDMVNGSFVTDFGTIKSDTTFYAVWLKNKYVVTWYLEAGKVFQIDTLAFGDAINAPTENPEREHYLFKGWAVAGDSVVADLGTISGNESFFAVWQEKEIVQYTAVWYYNDGTNSAFETTMVDFGAEIQAPSGKPNRDGYEFKGWSTTTDGAVATSFGKMSESGAAFYAVWEALVSFTAPETFNTCESGTDHIELTEISSSQIVFEWNVNGDIDSTQTDGYFEFTEDMALSGTIEVTGILGNVRVTKTINYQRNKDMLCTMWDDVITVVNGKGYFKSYKLYHNGELVDTTDMYYEKGGLTGTYYLVATTVDSVEITSCEMSFGEPQTTAITVYPNPVVNSIVVEGDNVKAGNTIVIIDNDGKVRIAKDISGDGSEEVNVSALQQGIYVVKVGEETVSVIKF